MGDLNRSEIMGNIPDLAIEVDGMEDWVKDLLDLFEGKFVDIKDKHVECGTYRGQTWECGQ